MRQRSQTQEVSTEDLREALLRYRSLFDELLRPEGNGAARGTTAQTNGSEPLGSDDADLADPDLDYDDQRIGRREGR